MKIPATSEADALAKAKGALPTLVSTSTVPAFIPLNGSYKATCTYSISNGYNVIAYSLAVTK